MISGVVNLVSMAQPVAGEHVLGELLTGLAVTSTGLVLWLLPWNRWPLRASLGAVPVAFLFTALSNWAGGEDPWSYAVFFLVAFAWVGICHRRGTSAMMLPLFAAAYLVPLLVWHQDSSVALASTIYVGLACLLIGESVAWVSARWRSAQADLKQHEAEERLHALVQNASDVIAIVSPDAAIQYCSPSVERVLGFSAGELAGRPFTTLVHDDDMARVERFLSECSSRAGSTVVGEWRLVHRDRTSRHVETLGANLMDHPQVRGLVLTARDISERKALEQQLAHQALHDALTNLANQPLFKERLTHGLTRCKRRKSSLAVLFVDLDNFKTVNDSRGHNIGDEVLAQVAERLGDCVREADTVARLGGDEFAVLLEDVRGPADAADAGARIMASLAVPLVVRGVETITGASIGIALRGSAADTADSLMRNADVAMYAAKRNGKGRFEFFDPSMHSAVIERLELESDLRRAIEAGELLMYYQPILDLHSGAVHSLEALVRWQHPTRGLLLPEAFLPLAEETGLIVPIGRFAIGEACRQLHTWHGLDGRRSHLGQREPLRAAAAGSEDRRRPQGGVASRRSRPALPDPRDHGDHSRPGHDDRQPPARSSAGAGHQAGAGRLRHRLLLAELPAAFPCRRPQGRPFVHGRVSGRRRRPDAHQGHHRPGACPRLADGRRGHRGRRGTRLDAEPGLRVRPGLSLRPPHGRRRGHRLPHARHLTG